MPVTTIRLLSNDIDSPYAIFVMAPLIGAMIGCCLHRLERRARSPWRIHVPLIQAGCAGIEGSREVSGLILNQRAYIAGRNTRVSTVPANVPPIRV